MAQEYMTTTDEEQVRGAGFSVFAGALLVMVGIFQALEGIAALLNDQLFVLGVEYVYSFDITAWGWWHIFWGALMTLAGFGIFTGNPWARGFGIFIAVLSAVANFAFIPYSPFWSILIIALNIGIIWGLANFNPRRIDRRGATA